MIGTLDRNPDGYKLDTIICSIQASSNPAVKIESFSNPALLQANPSVGLIFHMPCMYMWRIFKETFGTGKRSDAVHSEVKIAAAVRRCPFAAAVRRLHVHVADFQGNFRNGEAVRRCPVRCKGVIEKLM